MATWYSISTPEATTRFVSAWGYDAPIDDIELCEMLLDIAREQVLAYAPQATSPDDSMDGGTFDEEVIPARYVYAQLQQAKNLWNAGRSDSAGEVGGEGYVFQPRPLDKTIRALIRPITGGVNVF